MEIKEKSWVCGSISKPNLPLNFSYRHNEHNIVYVDI